MWEPDIKRPPHFDKLEYIIEELKCIRKLVFISCGAGGAEIFNCVTPKLENVVNIVLTDIAQDKNPNSIRLTLFELFEFLNTKNNEDIIVVGERSNSNYINNMITRYCKERGIYTICHLDLYGGYEERFVEMPDIVIVPSDKEMEELLHFGFKEENLIVGGNPSFDRILDLKYNRIVNTKIPNILYTSQCNNKEFYKIYEILCSEFDSFKLDIKLHPEEVNSTHIYPKECYVLKVDNCVDYIKECLNYDLLLGYNSTLQIQGHIIGIPTVMGEHLDYLKGIRDFKDSKFNTYKQERCVKFSLEESLSIYRKLRNI